MNRQDIGAAARPLGARRDVRRLWAAAALAALPAAADAEPWVLNDAALDRVTAGGVVAVGFSDASGLGGGAVSSTTFDASVSPAVAVANGALVAAGTEGSAGFAEAFVSAEPATLIAGVAVFSPDAEPVVGFADAVLIQPGAPTSGAAAALGSGGDAFADAAGGGSFGGDDLAATAEGVGPVASAGVTFASDGAQATTGANAAGEIGAYSAALGTGTTAAGDSALAFGVAAEAGAQGETRARTARTLLTVGPATVVRVVADAGSRGAATIAPAASASVAASGPNAVAAPGLFIPSAAQAPATNAAASAVGLLLSPGGRAAAWLARR